MKKSLRHLITALFTAAILAVPAAGYGNSPAPVWEIVATGESPDTSRDEIEPRDNIDIVNRDGVLYISVEQPVKVEIYPILGQLNTPRQLRPGTVRLSLRQRGVYILKAGSITRRINL